MTPSREERGKNESWNWKVRGPKMEGLVLVVTRCFKVGIQYIIYVRKLALLTGLVGRGKGGAILRAQQNKDFGAIPYFLVIADYEKAFLYVVLK
jgi:hypothetical protein